MKPVCSDRITQTIEPGTTPRPPHRARSVPLMAFTLLIFSLGSTLLVWDLVRQAQKYWPSDPFHVKVKMILTAAILLHFVGATLVYHVCRYVCALRERSHRPTGFSELNAYLAVKHEHPAPRVAILIPSYKEEIDVIRQTLLSAVFQSCPNRRVVLLLDDPVWPLDPRERHNLELARALPAEITALLAEPLALIEAANGRFDGVWPTSHAYSDAARQLSQLWFDAADWFERLAGQYNTGDHVQALIRDQFLLARCSDLRAHAALLRHAEALNLRHEYQRLRDLFTVPVSVFERKRYANLSHEPNKAMNLNAYLHLIGKTWSETTEGGQCLLHTGEHGADAHHETEAEYVVVLDADSLLGPNYAATLLNFMEEPNHARVAIVQSPYATVPNAPGYLERIAGAQTDAMYWTHQGMTAFGAASWVGAAALIRLRALREIVEASVEHGHPVVRYVKDRTVTEDADTTLDLLFKGWRVHNFPKRLNYSATPSDFGSLLIQRRRWATGGIMLVPKLLRYFWQSPSPQRLLEVMLRFHFLLSATISGLGMLILIAYPGAARLEVPLALLGLFTFVQVIEIVQLGHRKRDFIGLYTLNLFLVPINLSGTWHSFVQLATGRRGCFRRTPKVRQRTAAPRHHVLAQLFVMVAFASQAVHYAWGRHDWAATFGAGLGAGLMLFGLTRFIGLGNAWSDITGARRNEATQ